MKSAWLFAAPMLLVACRGTPPASAPQRVEKTERVVTQAAADPAPAAPKGPSADTCDGVRECATVGLALAEMQDLVGARVALAKACTGTVRSIDACAVLTTLLDEDTEATKVADTARHGCNVFGAEEGERAARSKACAVWGLALRDGNGTAADQGAALRAFDDGCRLGEARACVASRDLHAVIEAAADAESGIPGANLVVEKLTAKGVTVEKIACRADGGFAPNVLGGFAVGQAFVDKKAKLDACAKGAPHKARVRWTASSAGKMTNVKVISGDDPSNKCVERALTGAPATVPGTCAASVDLGKKK